jgi:uncharacterized membrane protein SpoIIM required for sporulation
MLDMRSQKFRSAAEMSFTTMILIILWWVFCALLYWLHFFVHDHLQRPKFRDSTGDITTEVGYDEDSLGRVVTHSWYKKAQMRMKRLKDGDD